jgi:type III secretion protein V
MTVTRRRAWLALEPVVLETSGSDESMTERLGALNEALFLELGIRFPEVKVERSEQPGFRLLCDEVEVAQGSGEPVAKLQSLLRRHARRFVTLQLVQHMLDDVAEAHPAVVKAIVPGVVSLPMLTEVLGRLAEEELSLRPLPAILQALGEVWRPGADGLKLSEGVRQCLKAEVTGRYAQRPGCIIVCLLEPRIEKLIEGAIRVTPDGTHLALEPDQAYEIVNAVRKESKHWNAAERPVIITTPAIRRFVRKVLEFEIEPPLRVVSYGELEPTVKIEPIGRVRLEEKQGS